MKIVKRLNCIMLAVVLVLTLTACGKDDAGQVEETDTVALPSTPDYPVISTEAWQQAQWIGADTCTGVSTSVFGGELYQDTSYSISCTFICPKWDIALVYGADNGSYGDYQMLRIGDVVSADQWTDEWHSAEHSLLLTMTENHRTVYVDDALVLDEDIEEAVPLLQWGFWSSRGPTYGLIDDISVINADGEILYEEDFSDESNTIFSPYYCKLQDGMLRVESGFKLIPGTEQPAPMLRRTFTVDNSDQVTVATWYSTALGSYELSMNGEAVDDEYLSPGISQYDSYIYYRTYDVTDRLISGDNCLGVMLGHGRYDRAGYEWGDTLAYAGMLVIDYADGSSETIYSDSDWQMYLDGPVRYDDLYQGEYYDSSYELADWNMADGTAIGWSQVDIIDIPYDSSEFTPAIANPVRVVETVDASEYMEYEDGTFLVDFGRNINGLVSLDIHGDAGSVVTIRYAEYLNSEDLAEPDDEDGYIYTANLYGSTNTDYYVKNSDKVENYTPSLVYRGFRYVQITGIDSMEIEDIKAYVISTDSVVTGSFDCSDESLNAIYNACQQTLVDNMVDIPTDCAQRDERLGWAGDAEVVASTALFNRDEYGLYKSYLKALAASQNSEGAYSEIAPTQGSISGGYGTNGWSDAGVILVWRLYEYYADLNLVQEHLDSMCNYIDYLESTSNGYLRDSSGYGDHNSAGSSDLIEINTAECAYVSGLVARMCALCEDDRADHYSDIYNNYVSAWRKAYVHEDGTVGSDSQYDYVLALGYGIVDADENVAATMAARLNELVVNSDYHPETGYITTEYLLPVLSDHGYIDTCYQLLQQTGYPGWNNMLSYGGTTMNESWFTITTGDDGLTYINGSMNHPGLSSVGQWFYTGILGIRINDTEPGFTHFTLEPAIGGDLDYARGLYNSIHGAIVSEWTRSGNKLTYHCEVPEGTTATLKLPGEKTRELEPGIYNFDTRIE